MIPGLLIIYKHQNTFFLFTAIKCPALPRYIADGRIHQDTSYGERDSFGVVARYKCDEGRYISGLIYCDVVLTRRGWIWHGPMYIMLDCTITYGMT